MALPVVVPGQTVSFEVDVADSDPNASGTFSYSVNWGVPGTLMSKARTGSGVVFNHVYSADGAYKITEALLQKGYAEGDVKKILGENTLRVMTDVQLISRELNGEKQKQESRLQ